MRVSEARKLASQYGCVMRQGKLGTFKLSGPAGECLITKAELNRTNVARFTRLLPKERDAA